ncbi:MAG: hydrogenase iron-sulfur subunit [candidate division WOR-3 bacterium]|nr:hydrogenase iron-sulfur subunit [candidate division WOR-3 bacterium]
MSEFQPKILGFLCNWCSYAGADLAGVSRIQYRPNIRVIRVMCSGRVDPVFIINAFLRKIDGVMVLGCHFGDCHYLNGNYNAEKRILAARKLLSLTEIEKDRLYLDWVSAAEGERFANLVNTFTERIKNLGEIKINDGTKEMLLAVKDVLEGERFRHLTGVEYQVTEKENVYGEKIPVEDFEKKLEQILYEEYIKARILRLLQNNELTIPQIAQKLNTALDFAFKCVCSLQENNIVEMKGIRNGYPIYSANKY